MSGVDWTEVEGTIGKTVYFTVYKCDETTVEDLSLYDEAKIQLKVWQDDKVTLKFEKDVLYVTTGADGRVKATLDLATDIAYGDEGTYFFTIELENAAGVVIPTVREVLYVTQGAPL